MLIRFLQFPSDNAPSHYLELYILSLMTQFSCWAVLVSHSVHCPGNIHHKFFIRHVEAARRGMLGRPLQVGAGSLLCSYDRWEPPVVRSHPIGGKDAKLGWGWSRCGLSLYGGRDNSGGRCGILSPLPDLGAH